LGATVATLSLAVALSRDVVRSAVARPPTPAVCRPASSPEGRDARVTDIDDRDASLVERARQGDQAAFGELVSTYEQVAFRAAYLVTRDRDDAADAAQQAFIKAYRALGRFRRGSPFRPWLVQIATNEARNLRRAAGARGRLVLRVGHESDIGDSPEALVEAVERRSLLLAALDRCRREDQEIIGYRYFLELSESEMAIALDCPSGTVKSRLSRALGRLRVKLTSSLGATALGEPR
jgi:RNA polymerase sigma factor (sigma-70 family)